MTPADVQCYQGKIDFVWLTKKSNVNHKTQPRWKNARAHRLPRDQELIFRMRRWPPFISTHRNLTPQTPSTVRVRIPPMRPTPFSRLHCFQLREPWVVQVTWSIDSAIFAFQKVRNRDSMTCGGLKDCETFADKKKDSSSVLSTLIQLLESVSAECGVSRS